MILCFSSSSLVVILVVSVDVSIVFFPPLPLSCSIIVFISGFSVVLWQTIVPPLSLVCYFLLYWIFVPRLLLFSRSTMFWYCYYSHFTFYLPGFFPLQSMLAQANHPGQFHCWILLHHIVFFFFIRLLLWVLIDHFIFIFLMNVFWHDFQQWLQYSSCFISRVKSALRSCFLNLVVINMYIFMERGLVNFYRFIVFNRFWVNVSDMYSVSGYWWIHIRVCFSRGGYHHIIDARTTSPES